MSAGPRCLVCGSTAVSAWTTAVDVEYKSVPNRFGYYECRACDTLSIDPVPKDKLSLIYPASYYSFSTASAGAVQGIKDRLDAARFSKILSGIAGQELSVLDIGGGNGHQLDVARSADERVTKTTIVDFDADAGAHAESRGHRFVQGRIEETAFTEQFDLILMLNLIEHVEDPGAILNSARSLLKPGGVVVVQTPNWRSLDASLFRTRNWGGLHCPRHWVIFSADGFTRFAGSKGYDVRSWSYTQGAPFWAVSLVALLDRGGLVSITAERPIWKNPFYSPLAALFAAFDFVRRPVSSLSQAVYLLTSKS